MTFGRALWGVLAASVLAAAGCAAHDDVIVKTGADKKLSDAQIDAEPVALLPGSAVGVAYVDARKLFASSFGARMLAVSERRMPLPAAAGFDPKRDLEALWIESGRRRERHAAFGHGEDPRAERRREELLRIEVRDADGASRKQRDGLGVDLRVVQLLVRARLDDYVVVRRAAARGEDTRDDDAEERAEQRHASTSPSEPRKRSFSSGKPNVTRTLVGKLANGRTMTPRRRSAS